MTAPKTAVLPLHHESKSHNPRFSYVDVSVFFLFNKPAGLTLLKLVKLLGASITWLYSKENSF